MVSDVANMNTAGSSVYQIVLPRLSSQVVPINSANAASNWLVEPKISQTALCFPVRDNDNISPTAIDELSQ